VKQSSSTLSISQSHIVSIIRYDIANLIIILGHEASCVVEAEVYERRPRMASSRKQYNLQDEQAMQMEPSSGNWILVKIRTLITIIGAYGIKCHLSTHSSTTKTKYGSHMPYPTASLCSQISSRQSKKYRRSLKMRRII
jgi:hypothetical protein